MHSFVVNAGSLLEVYVYSFVAAIGARAGWTLIPMIDRIITNRKRG